ncbi:MAG: T9SS type A sorting domain-containing protein [Balneolaceae bacterium]|nr:T9SS type A sorting domain-containing protein [Balneolaceae bacterium]
MRPFFAPMPKYFLFLCISLIPLSVFGQHPVHVHTVEDHPAIQSIELAYNNGELSVDEAILQKVYAGLKPERLHARFAHSDDTIIKCLTPIMASYYNQKDNLSAATVYEIESLFREDQVTSQQALQHLSPSGNFVMIYETEGVHAVPPEDSNGSGVPDYIEHAAFAADSSYRHQIETLGFRDFLQDEPYQILFRNINSYGRTTTTGGSGTFITVHSTFQNFPPNTHPEGDAIGALYVTIAHEIKHASQYVTSRWQGDSGSFNWIEMDATLMEEVVFPDVNDYYNYIMLYDSQNRRWNQNNPHRNSIFGNPQNATPGAYWHVSWMLYFYEQFGGEFFADVWREFIEDRQLPMFDAMQRNLLPLETSLEREHLKNHMWHMASGPERAPTDFGFRDRINYPNPSFAQSLAFTPDSLGPLFLQPMAATYVDVQPSNVNLGQPAIRVDSDVPGVVVGVLGYFRDGSTDFQLGINPNSSSQLIQTTWSWSDLIDMSIAVVNTNRNDQASYNLTVTSVLPNEDSISQNYPNPFNSSTNIEFSLTENKHVRVDVFDAAGRRVQTIVDEQLNRGFHSVRFDGSGLSSGVYIYRILTDQTIVTKKMVLVK